MKPHTDTSQYSASEQAKHQFAGHDNNHAGGHAGKLEANDTQRGVEEVPFEDDRPEHTPEGDKPAKK